MISALCQNSGKRFKNESSKDRSPIPWERLLYCLLWGICVRRTRISGLMQAIGVPILVFFVDKVMIKNIVSEWEVNTIKKKTSLFESECEWICMRSVRF